MALNNKERNTGALEVRASRQGRVHSDDSRETEMVTNKRLKKGKDI